MIWIWNNLEPEVFMYFMETSDLFFGKMYLLYLHKVFPLITQEDHLVDVGQTKCILTWISGLET